MKIKTWHWILLIVVVIAVIITIIIIRKRKSSKVNLEPSTDATETKGMGLLISPSNTNTTVTSISKFPLKKGSTGNEVKVLQKYLNDRYKSGLNVDGIFGILTESALLKNEGIKTVSWTMYGTKISIYH